MSRIAKWKLEKTKVKVVFRLQFHATNIPQTGWEKLFVSFFPTDSVKATAKTSKASVRNGTCKWADPIYETTRLIQDTKSKLYDEKRYKLVVAMGSSRSSLLGEANINLADYVDASQPSAIALPLQGCNFGTILHVTVQPLNSKTGFREFEQQRELRETGFQTTSNNVYDESSAKLSCTQVTSDQIEKVSSRVRFQSESKELPSLEEVSELNEDYADSATGIDVSSTTSGSIYAEKHDSSTHEIDSLKSTTSGDLGGLSLHQSSHPDKGDHLDHRLSAQGANEWIQGWSSDYSMDNDLAAAFEENSRIRGSLDMVESSILDLKLEVSSLENHATELGAKTQNFAQVLDAEVVSGEKLAKEVSVLKSECSKIKNDFEQLQQSKLTSDLTASGIITKDQVHLFQDLHTRWIQGLLVVEEKVREVQNKAGQQYHERDFSFYPDLELLEKFLQDLRQGTTQVLLSLSLKPAEEHIEIKGTSVHESQQLLSRDRLQNIDRNLYENEDILHVPVTVSQQPDPVDTTTVLEGKISELHKELEDSKFERDSLVKKLDQMECYYEALIQELEESQKQMLGELQSLRNEHSTCLYTLSSCKTQMEAMHQDMNTQFLRFTDDMHNLESLNQELEKRAIASEAALKRVRWNHSVAVGQLQKDLELLSFQVLSMFETNDNLIKQAFVESSQDCLHEYLDENSEAVDSCLQKDYTQLLDEQTSARAIQAPGFAVPEPLQCHNHNMELKRQLLSGEILFEDMKRSLQLQEELYQKAEDELYDMHVVNLNMDVFSKVLQETLRESSNGIKLMKEKLDDLSQQLIYSTASKELLMLRLESSLNDLNVLNKSNAECISKYDELVLQNQIQEKKLQGTSCKNDILAQKVLEYEDMIMECRSYEEKYEVCSAEKMELLNVLKQETEEKGSLENEVRYLQEELRNLKADFDIQLSLKGSLEKTISTLQEKFGVQNEMLEKKLQKTSDENSVLTQRVLEYEKLVSKCESYESKYEICAAENAGLVDLLKQETMEKSNLHDEVDYLQEKLSNLKAEFGIQSSLKENLEKTISTLEKLSFQNQVLEEKFQGVSAENRVLMQKVSEYERLSVEYRSYENRYEVCTAEKMSLQNSLTQESLEKCDLQNEISSLRDDLKKLQADFDIQSSVKDDLEKTLSYLQGKLRDLISTMASYNEQVDGPIITSLSIQKEGDNKNFTSTFLHLEQLQGKAYEKIAQLIQEKKSAEEQRDLAHESLSGTQSEIINIKQKFTSDVQKMLTKLDMSMYHLEKLQRDIENVGSKLKLSLETEERFAEISKDMSSRLAVFEAEVQVVTDDNKDLAQRILALQNVIEELESTKLAVVDSARENQAMAISLHASNEESVKLANELKSVKQNLRCAQDDLLTETILRDELQSEVADLSSQLKEKNEELLHFDTCKGELVHVKQLVSDIEREKARVCCLLLQSEDSGRKADTDMSSLRLQVTDLESQLTALVEYLLASDVELTFTRNQFKSRMQELVQQLESLDRCYRELHFKHLDVLNTVNGSISCKAQYVEENAGLLSILNSLRSELEATATEKMTLLDRSNSISLELEKHQMGAEQAKHQHEIEIEHMKSKLLSSEEAIDNMTSSMTELEVTVIVLQNKLNEQRPRLLLLQDYDNELTVLRNQQKDLMHKLSEQNLRTEEFKNLSTHLKELKDKAEAECLQVREKREAEGQSVATQESLRMAFVREQCETKLQEMKSQLFISKKHGEEMLFKLQDALDELENRRKTEALHIKRNDELSSKILELESELQTVLADKREKVNNYDRMKAELECSLISLECCKEEKQKLEATLKECNEERSKITTELDSVKERLLCSIRDEGDSETVIPVSMSTEMVTDEVLREEANVSSDVPVQDGITGRGALGISRRAILSQEDLLQNNAKHLISRMGDLHKELEKMKNDNLASLLPEGQQHLQPVFQDLQRELLQLQKANKQLGSMFPLFSEFSSCGNAMERVLALELELAEALQANRKSSIHFQSSFLKQHSDEEAIFQSFKDINELIKDMLDLKGKYVTVETELKEMHDRYSQLSLQFAEVEGERQKLVMTLKNTKTPKKAAFLYRSTSEGLADHS